MKIFNLPDLGEGLPDAQIREWHIKPGDDVQADQPIASMETAKALVDVPAPYSGRIEKLFGDIGDTIETGQPLVGFVADTTADEPTSECEDTATHTASNPRQATTSQRPKASPAVRKLAKELGVDLTTIVASGTSITLEEVKVAASTLPAMATALEGELTALSPVKRAMVLSMTESHQTIVPVSINDDADIQAWPTKTDVTVRLLRALQQACKAEPMLNVHFDSTQLAYLENKTINVGIAIDTPHGLYVPVIRDLAHRDDASLRDDINRLKQQALDKSIPQADLHGATIMLSNFGSVAGRYANPIIVPPMVAIVGVGKSREAVVAKEGKPVVHRILPLSVTVDHRAVTGGEAARFLGAMIQALESTD